MYCMNRTKSTIRSHETLDDTVPQSPGADKTWPDEDIWTKNYRHETAGARSLCRRRDGTKAASLW